MQGFALEPFLGQWFEWERINKCFWPGAGGRSEKLTPNFLLQGFILEYMLLPGVILWAYRPLLTTAFNILA